MAFAGGGPGGGGVAVTLTEEGETVALVAVPQSGVDLEAVERALIAFALDQAGGNRTRAARFLRLTRSALLYRMHKYGLVSAELSARPADRAEVRRPT